MFVSINTDIGTAEFIIIISHEGIWASQIKVAVKFNVFAESKEQLNTAGISPDQGTVKALIDIESVAVFLLLNEIQGFFIFHLSPISMAWDKDVI